MADQPELVVKVEISAQDEITVSTVDSKTFELKAQVCGGVFLLLSYYKEKYGLNPKIWPQPTGTTHSEIILRQLISKLNGTYDHPYAHDELCHCRSVPTQTVERAIISGAHNVELVAQLTSAGTACGTCRPETQKLINFFLQSE